jgi:predicted nucleic acid-binding protein
VQAAFEGRVLGIDNAVSDQWGRISAIRPIPVIDGLLAATALTNGPTLVTRCFTRRSFWTSDPECAIRHII